MYHVMRTVWEKSSPNPPFLRSDRGEKARICGVSNLHECLVCREEFGGGGDHVYEIQGFANFDPSRRGRFCSWNTLPVCVRHNKSYKVAHLPHSTVNLGYHTLSTSEQIQLTPLQRRTYHTIQAWKAYVASRGATLSFQVNPAQMKSLDTKVADGMRGIVDNVHAVSSIENSG